MCLCNIRSREDDWLTGFKLMRRAGTGRYGNLSQGSNEKTYRKNYTYNAKHGVDKPIRVWDRFSSGGLPIVRADDGGEYEAGFHVFQYCSDARKQLMLLSPHERAVYAIVYVECREPIAYGLQEEMLGLTPDRYWCGVFRKMKIKEEVSVCA